jgi:hypothetical protein
LNDDQDTGAKDGPPHDQRGDGIHHPNITDCGLRSTKTGDLQKADDSAEKFRPHQGSVSRYYFIYIAFPDAVFSDDAVYFTGLKNPSKLNLSILDKQYGQIQFSKISKG